MGNWNIALGVQLSKRRPNIWRPFIFHDTYNGSYTSITPHVYTERVNFIICIRWLPVRTRMKPTNIKSSDEHPLQSDMGQMHFLETSRNKT